MPTSNQKVRLRIDPALAITTAIGVGVWWFLNSNPSTAAWIIAALLFTYLCLGWCYLAFALPQPSSDAEPSHTPQHFPTGSDPEKLMSTTWKL